MTMGYIKPSRLVSDEPQPAPLFIDVVTRPIDDADETPPRRQRINYSSERARKWLILGAAQRTQRYGCAG